MNVSLTQRLRSRAALVTAGLLLAVAAPTAYAAFDDAETGGAALRGDPYVETLLFFGTERPDGGPASAMNEALYVETRALLPTLLHLLEESDWIVDPANLSWRSVDAPSFSPARPVASSRPTAAA